MFIGPGDYGAFDRDSYEAHVREGSETRSKVTQVRDFSQGVKIGDLVLMRHGYSVKQIGIAHESGYEWKELFDDVLGWDLQHTRRVVWQEHLRDDLVSLQRSKALFSSRKQIPAFTRVRDERILGPLRPLLERVKDRPLKALPRAIPKPLSNEELGEALFARGLANGAVEKVVHAIERTRRLHRWYDRFGNASGRPSEHEVVAHVILPLLTALGWSEQLLAVEWSKVDLAGFSATPTTARNCILVCEAKGRGQGLRNVVNQAADYTRRLKLEGCRALMCTDGLSMFLYTKQGGLGDWFPIPAGTINVTRIRTESIITRTSGVDTLMSLTPGGVLQLKG